MIAPFRQHTPPRVGQVNADTTAYCVAGENPRRDTLAIVNNGPATVYVGFNPGVSTVTGFGLPANAGIALSYVGAVYVIAAASGSTVSYIEESG